MEKRTFLIVLLFFLLFFLGSIDSEVKGALIPINGEGGCVDRGAFCLASDDCCAGECADGSCQCLSSICCKLGPGMERGEDCYCEEECRDPLTCTMSIDGDKECCDDRSDWKRDIGVTCYCDVECKSGYCIGGVCAEADTCSQAGCACIDTIINCERLIGGEDNPSLICPDPTYDVCCCPQELPPPNGDGFCDSPCDSPCTCIYGFCSGDSVPIDCCGGSTEYLCCCPVEPSPSTCSDASDASRSCGCISSGACMGEGGDIITDSCPDTLICCCTLTPPAVCGNGVVENGEECDDGNTVSGDGCSDSCILEPEDSGFKIGDNGGIIDLQSPLGCTTIEECISRMINFLFSLAVILTPLMIVLAGFLYITAAGKPEKIVQAQKLITWTLIGFLIVSLARAIIYVITSVIGG